MPHLTQGQRAQVDRLGALQRLIAEFKPIRNEHDLVMKEADSLAKEIASWIPQNTPAENGVVLEGERYNAQISARSNERRVKDFAPILKAIGQKAFLAAASIPLKVLDVLLNDEQKAKYISQERTGSRRVTCVAREVEQSPDIAVPQPRSNRKLRAAA